MNLVYNRLMVRLLWITLCAGALAGAEPGVRELLERGTVDEIRAVAARLDGVLGVAAIDLTTGRALALNAETVFPQASSIKVPLMVTLFRAARAGAFRLTDTVALARTDAAGGSGRLGKRLESGPLQLTVRELIALVGRERVNRTMDELGLPATRLLRVMMDSAAAARDEENVSTPMEMARLLESLWRHRAADADSCREMIEILKLAAAEMKGAVPDGVEVASKPGVLDGVRCETGIVFLERGPFALAVMTAYLDRGRNPVAEVTDIVYRHFEKAANANRYQGEFALLQNPFRFKGLV
jgi:beta-lactamase class A